MRWPRKILWTLMSLTGFRGEGLDEFLVVVGPRFPPLSPPPPFTPAGVKGGALILVLRAGHLKNWGEAAVRL